MASGRTIHRTPARGTATPPVSPPGTRRAGGRATPSFEKLRELKEQNQQELHDLAMCLSERAHREGSHGSVVRVAVIILGALSAAKQALTPAVGLFAGIPHSVAQVLFTFFGVAI